MAAVEVESINSASSPWVVPLVEANLIKYTASMEREIRRQHQHGRRTLPDDCCRYCELYRDGTMTQSKQHEIDVWRRQVNQTLLQQHFRARSTTSKQASLRNIKHLYTAPGIPDTEPGFRRVKDLNHIKDDRPKRSVSAHGKRSMSGSLSVDLSALSLHTPKSAYTRGEFNHTYHGHSYNGTKAPQSSINSSRTQSNASSQDSRKMTKSSRTCSHDQCHNKESERRLQSATNTSSRMNGSLTTRSEVSKSATHSIKTQKTATSTPTNNIETNTNLGTITERSSNMNVHQRLYNGGAQRQILSERSSDIERGLPAESKTFRRLHRNLHRWIDDELMKPRQVVARRAKALAARNSGSLEQHKNSQIHKSAPSLVNDHNGHLRDPAHGESFLGMLIEMDKSTTNTTLKTDKSATTGSTLGSM